MTSSRLLCQCSQPDGELWAGMAEAALELPLATPHIPLAPGCATASALGTASLELNAAGPGWLAHEVLIFGWVMSSSTP